MQQTTTIVGLCVRIQGSVMISFLLQLRTVVCKVKVRVKFTRLKRGSSNVLEGSVELKSRLSLRTVVWVAW